MARYSAGTVVDFSKSVRIVVIGDKGTGKSSLIAAAATNSFPANVPPVLPDTKLPLQFFPDGIPVTIVDTSSRPEDRGMVAEELKHADAVVLTHASDDRPETLQRLSTYWLPELRRLEVKVPIVVAGCKLDLDKNQASFEQVMSPIMNQFREIETCIECSALKQIQSVELTDVAIEFLKEKYMLFDADGDNNLRPQEIEDLFSTAPESPWKEAPYEDAAEKTALGGLSSDSFLSLWSLMTVLEPARSVEHLICIGFQGDPSSAIRITRRRLLDRKKKRCERKVVQCFVFGPNSARKSALLNCFLGRSYADNPGSTTTDERYAVNMVDETGSAKKTLVMREIPEDGAQGLFSSMESLAKCDIAVFVYDRSFHGFFF